MEQKTDITVETKKKDGSWGQLWCDYARELQNRKNLFLFWAFLIPMGILFLLYATKSVFPLGEGSVLILDLNGQYVYFFEELREKVLSGGSLLYSWSRALGGEFLGIFAYYLASPFSLLVCLFPKAYITEALLVIFLLKAGSCGFTMALYLSKAYPTRKVSTVIFSTMYALCAYAVVQAHNTMWIDEMIFLPLVVLGIERLIKKKDFVLYTVSLAFCAMTNFYIGYMVCIFTFFYFFYYYFAKSGNGENNPTEEKHHFIKSLLRMFAFSVIALEIAMVVLYPAYISLSFGKNTFSNPNFEFVQRFDFLDFITKMFPASYDTVRPEGLPFIYCGILTLIMLPMFFLAKHIRAREKFAGGALIAVFVVSMMGSTIDMVWHGFQKPNWLNYRYSFILVFIMVVFAYRAFAEIKTMDYKHIVAICGVLVLLLVIIQKQDYEWMDDLLTIWISVGFIGLYLGVLYLFRKGWLVHGGSLALVVLVCFELTVSGAIDENSMDKDVVFSSRTSYQSYMNKLSPMVETIKEYDAENFGSEFYRMEKTSHRKTNDAMALDMNGISNSTSTLNAGVIDLLGDLGYTSMSHWAKYLGGTPLSDSLLGIKYVINTEQYQSDFYELISSDKQNDLYGYYNPYALSLVYGVDPAAIAVDFDSKEISATPFERMNALVTAMLGETETVEVFKKIEVDTSEINLNKGYTGVTENGQRNIHYSPEVSDSTAKLSFEFFGAGSGNEIFCYFPTNYKRDASLYKNGEKLGAYFNNDGYHIYSLGIAGENTRLTVDLQLDEEDMYIVDKVDYFFYLDGALFDSVMEQLSESQMEITHFEDTVIKGEATVAEGDTLMYTSIPYDSGWKVTVDGEAVETMNTPLSLLAFEVEAGEHSIELKYRPECFTYGLIVTGAGLVTFVAAIIITKPESIVQMSEAVRSRIGKRKKKKVKQSS